MVDDLSALWTGVRVHVSDVRVCVCMCTCMCIFTCIYVPARARACVRRSSTTVSCMRALVTQQPPRDTQLGRSGDTESEPQAGLRASPLFAATHPPSPLRSPPRPCCPLPQSSHLREHGGPPRDHPARPASLRACILMGVSSLSPLSSLSLSLSLAPYCRIALPLHTQVRRPFPLSLLHPANRSAPFPYPLAHIRLAYERCVRVAYISRALPLFLFSPSRLTMRHYTTTYTCAPRGGMLGPAEHERARVCTSYNRFHHERQAGGNAVSAAVYSHLPSLLGIVEGTRAATEGLRLVSSKSREFP